MIAGPDIAIDVHGLTKSFGDRVVVRWIFEFEWLDGTFTRMEELAYQRWAGERIVEEQFFYDPAQRIPRKPDPQ